MQQTQEISFFNSLEVNYNLMIMFKKCEEMEGTRVNLDRITLLREICSMQSLYDEQQRFIVWSALTLTAK